MNSSGLQSISLSKFNLYIYWDTVYIKTNSLRFGTNNEWLRMQLMYIILNLSYNLKNFFSHFSIRKFHLTKLLRCVCSPFLKFTQVCFCTQTVQWALEISSQSRHTCCTRVYLPAPFRQFYTKTYQRPVSSDRRHSQI